jgi:glycosyltransferase involved in cell wall biosynthesis
MTDAEARSIALVDVSSHGGIAVYTDLVARALTASGAEAVVIGSRALGDAERPYAVRRILPRQRWGRPSNAGLRFFAGRALGWGASALAVEALALAKRPSVVHFQTPINRRFDAVLVRALRVLAPVVWTAHDVLPFDPAPGDERRFAALYRAVDAVLVHGEPAAAQVRALAGVDPVVVEHVVPEAIVDVGRAEARERLGIPPAERMLAAVGFVRRYKNYELLADVWDELGTRAPLLLVLGEVLDESERGALERLERSGRALVRPGYASDVDLQLSIRAADALVLPHRTASESGLLHQARALGVPVLASSAPQLAAAVESTSAGYVVADGVAAWAAAVTGPLPPPPPAPPSLAETGRAHLEAYAAAARRRSSRRR